MEYSKARLKKVAKRMMRKRLGSIGGFLVLMIAGVMCIIPLHGIGKWFE
jgi:hypothetical protein